MRTGLIGYPIGHSLSPAIHNAVYAELGLKWEYGLYPCEDSAAFLRTITEAAQAPDGFVGFNVTTPYKPAAYEACTEHSPFALVTGSSNVLTFPVGTAGDVVGCADDGMATDGAAVGDVAVVGAVGGTVSEAVAGGATGDSSIARPRLRGDNTDGRGLVASLEREGGVRVAGSSVVLCGTGPVAMSALLALMESGAASVDIASRDPGKGLERVDLLCERLERERLEHERLERERRAPRAARAGDASPMPTERRVDRLSIPRGTDGRFILPVIRAIDCAEAAARLETADILIDATPVGMGSADGAVVPLEALTPGLVVFDAVYGHGETAIIRAAREAGAIAIDGLGMLIEQAALTVEIWAREQGTPVEVSRTTMRRAALKHPPH